MRSGSASGCDEKTVTNGSTSAHGEQQLRPGHGVARGDAPQGNNFPTTFVKKKKRKASTHIHIHMFIRFEHATLYHRGSIFQTRATVVIQIIGRCNNSTRRARITSRESKGVGWMAGVFEGGEGRRKGFLTATSCNVFR